MPKLNQIIAIEKGIKNGADKRVNKIERAMSRPELLQGISRTYQPKDDEGEQLPPESKLVQMRVTDGLRQISESLTELFDITAGVNWYLWSNVRIMTNYVHSILRHGLPTPSGGLLAPGKGQGDLFEMRFQLDF